MGMHYTHLLIPVGRESKPAPEEVRQFFAAVGDLGAFTAPSRLELAGAAVPLARLPGAIEKRKRGYVVAMGGALTPGFEAVRTLSAERTRKAKIPNLFTGESMDVFVLERGAEQDWLGVERWEAAENAYGAASIRCCVTVEPVARWSFETPYRTVDVDGRGGARFTLEITCFEKGEAPLFIRSMDLAHPAIVHAAEGAFGVPFRQGCRWG